MKYALIILVPICGVLAVLNTSITVEVMAETSEIIEDRTISLEVLGLYPTLTLIKHYSPHASIKGTKVITAYTLGREEENDDDPCIGAYNDNLCELAEAGVSICASRTFEKGTLLRFGDTECIVLDKTSRKYADRVDLAMLDYSEAIKFGYNELPVSVVGHAIFNK